MSASGQLLPAAIARGIGRNAPIPDLPVLVREGRFVPKPPFARNIGHPRHPADTGMASRSFLWGTLAIGGFCAHGGGSRHRKAGSRHHTTSRIGRGAKDNPPVVLLGFELQEIYGNDIRSFRAVIPKAPAIQRSALASGRSRAIPSSTVRQGAGAS